ncbi:MAG: hypothetical protein C4288_20900 [Leptolyngbya sp. ERB_1_1]
MAKLHLILEWYAEAEPLCLQAIAIFYQRLGEPHPSTQTVLRNFRYFLDQALQGDRLSKLSDHPMTRSLLEQLQSASD